MPGKAWPAARSALLFVFQLGLWSVVLDLHRFVGMEHPPTTSAIVGAMLAQAVLSLLALMPAAVLLGLWWVLVKIDLQERGWTLSRGLRSVWEWSDADGRQLPRQSVSIVTWPLTLGLGGTLAYGASRHWISAMAQPHFAAAAVVASHVGAVLAALLMHPAIASVSRGALRLLAKLPLASALTHQPRRLAAGVALLGLSAALVGIVILRDPLSFLPWTDIAQLVLALVLASIGSWWLRSSARATAVALALAAAVLLVAGGRPAVDRATATQARRLLHTELLASRVALPVVEAWLDLDDDGYLHGIAGGDCAAFDAARHPAAVEIPENGIDEDCDGNDLTATPAMVRGRHDWPLPDDAPREPHIVLITVDAFAGRKLGNSREGRPITPNLHALAQRSAYFPNAFSQGPSTRLSMPSLFTGNWDTQIQRTASGRHPYPITDSELLLAEMLASAGYRTTAVLPKDYFQPEHWGGLTDGFEVIVDDPVHHLDEYGHNASRVTNAALKALERPGNAPQFLWVHYYDAHPPQRHPEGIEPFGNSQEDQYDAELRLIDRELGRLLAGIEARWKREALIVVTSDHGIAFDELRHGKRHYGHDLLTSTLHVPLIFHGPLIEPHSFEQLASTQDVVPTLANLLGLEIAPRWGGTSLVPEIIHRRTRRPQELMHQFFLTERRLHDDDPLVSASLRTPRYNLIHDRKAGTYQLYDWTQDYQERQDLSADPGIQPIFASLRGKLAAYMSAIATHGRQTSRPAPATPQ